MKVIELSDRVIPVEKIDYIKYSWSSQEYGSLYLKNGERLVLEEKDFKKVKNYLLSLNEEDKSPLSEVQRLFNKLDNQDQEYVLNILRFFNQIPTTNNIEK